LALQLVALARPNAGDESLRYFGQLIQQFPGNPEAYYYRASVYGQLKNYAAALTDSNTFVRLNPGDVAGYEQRAAIKAAMGDQQGSKADQDAAASMLAAENGGNATGKTLAKNTPQNNTSQNNAPPNNAPANNNPAATASYPAMWTLLEFNQSYKLTQLEDHFYFQGLTVNSTGEAGKTTDKKGNVVYKGKWRQQNTNGTVNVWNFVLKKVTPQRIEGTVMTLGFTGQTVTFVPLR
jgi:tetratricopeptide (TPR) repeat protein